MIKNCLSAIAVGLVTAGLFAGAGCEWSGGGGAGSFNTSQGAGININFSGVYDGRLAGGKAVESTSAGSINRLTISQSGNRLDVRDNQGSHYVGQVGTPGAIVNLETVVNIPSGAEIVQSQISWSGKDEVAQKDVEFVGIIHAVSVTDIDGKRTVRTQTQNNQSSSSKDTDTSGKVTRTINDGTNTTVITIVPLPNGGSSVTTVVYNNQTGAEISRTVTTESSSSRTSSDVTVTVTTKEFTLTEANTQYRLEGTWVEKGGKASAVDALSPGGAGTVTTTSTEETTTTP